MRNSNQQLGLFFADSDGAQELAADFIARHICCLLTLFMV